MIDIDNEMEVFNSLRCNELLLEPVDVENPVYVENLIDFMQKYQALIDYFFSKDHIDYFFMNDMERSVFYSQIEHFTDLFDQNITALKSAEGVDFSTAGQVVRINCALIEFFNTLIQRRGEL